MSGEQEGLPEGWSLVPLKDLVTIGRGNTEPNQHPDEEFNYVALENVSKGTGQLVDFTPTAGVNIGSTKARFVKGDVLYGKLRPYLQKAVVAPFDGVSVTDLIPLVPARGVTAAYLLHFLLGPQHLDYITPLLAGIRMPRLRKDDIESMPIPIPGSNEQRRIVAKIESLQARSEAAKEALDAIPPLLEKFRQSVLAAAFRGDLTASWRAKNPDVEPASVLLERIRAERRTRWIADEAEKGRARAEARARKAGKPWTAADDAKVLDKERVKAAKKYKEPVQPLFDAKSRIVTGILPDGWVHASLDEVSELSTGKTPSTRTPSFWGGDIPFITPSQIHPRGRILPAQRTVTEEGAAEARLLSPGAILIVCIGSVGKSGLLDRMAIFNQQINAAVASPLMETNYLASWCKALRPWIEATAAATVNAAILNKGRLAQAVVPVAPLEEQAEIARLIDESFGFADTVEQMLSDARTNASTLNQSILAKAFRGELVPQDPTDEPASVLLERIRAERAQAEADKKAAKKRGRKKA